jgi:hypothetical protein
MTVFTALPMAVISCQNSQFFLQYYGKNIFKNHMIGIFKNHMIGIFKRLVPDSAGVGLLRVVVAVEAGHGRRPGGERGVGRRRICG